MPRLFDCRHYRVFKQTSSFLEKEKGRKGEEGRKPKISSSSSSPLLLILPF
jgi:hypothetical protein